MYGASCRLYGLLHCRTMVLITLFSQHMHSVKIPVFIRRAGMWKKSGYRLFQAFPVTVKRRYIALGRLEFVYSSYDSVAQLVVLK